MNTPAFSAAWIRFSFSLPMSTGLSLTITTAIGVGPDVMLCRYGSLAVLLGQRRLGLGRVAELRASHEARRGIGEHHQAIAVWLRLGVVGEDDVARALLLAHHVD